MKKIIPLIFSVFYLVNYSSAQAVGGWGNCEFATVTTMNAFDPSTTAFDCKKVYVQATGDHYHWDGSAWVLDGSDGTNIYNADGTLQADRTVTMDGNDLIWDGTLTGDVIIESDGDVGIGTLAPSQKLHVGGENKVQVGTFAGSGGGKMRVDIGDGEAEVQAIKTMVLQTTGNNYAVNGTAAGVGATTNTGLYGWAAGATNNYGLHIDSGLGIFDDSVGIGTNTPDAMLDVEGGQVRFSDYGNSPATYTGTTVSILAVDTDGDIIEVDPSTLGGGSSSSAVGTIYIDSGDEVETTLSQDTPTKAEGTTTLINATNVDMPSDNRIRYTGTTTQTFFVSCNISAWADGNNKQFYYSIRKNGSDVPSILSATHFNNQNASNERNSTTVTGTVELSEDDYLELWIEHVGDDEDVTVTFMNFTIMSVGGGGGSGGSSDNIYTADGTLGADRTMTMDGNDLTFDGTGDVIIQDDGKVGIGTTTPEAQLEVTYNRDPGFLPDSDDGFNSYLSSLVAVNENSSSWSRSLTALTPNVADGDKAGLLTFGTGDATAKAGHMYFVTSATSGEEYIGFGIRSTGQDFLNILGTGDVGIGTTTPNARLDVEGGQVRFSDYGNSPATYTGTTVSILAVDTDGDIIEVDPSTLGGGSSSNIYNANGTLSGDRTVTMGTNDLTFESGSGSLVLIDGFTGSTKADPIFELDRDAGRELGFYHSDDTNSGYWTIGTSDGIALELDNTDGKGVYLDSDGQFGIGISNPSNTLHITESGSGTAASATAGTIFLEHATSGGSNSIVFESAANAGSDYAYIEFSDDGSGNGSSSENGLLEIGTENDGAGGIYQDDIAIMPSGYLGVGTTAPEALFHVSGGTVKFSNYGAGTYEVGTPSWFIGVDADGDLVEIDPSSITGGGGSADNLGDHTAEENLQMTDFWISNDGDDEGIYVEGDGDVGIGTDNPTGAFEVAGGQVRFSDYGAGTNKGTATQTLSVTTDGDIVEMNTVTSSRLFYPPPVAVPASSTGTGFTVNLHTVYENLFNAPAYKNTSAAATIPSYSASELDYYVVDYDTTVFTVTGLTDAGLMTYTVNTVPTDNCSYMTVIFYVK